VPAEYLLEILRSGEAQGELKEYIQDVKEILEVEVQAKLN
jgi:t-SNARE complex subunit (syntaxin)